MSDRKITQTFGMAFAMLFIGIMFLSAVSY